jgi:hypothetical protein
MLCTGLLGFIVFFDVKTDIVGANYIYFVQSLFTQFISSYK